MSGSKEKEPAEQSPVESSPMGWRIMRWGIITLAVIATLIAAVYLVEGIRGKRAWKKFQAEMAASGETLEAKDLLPKPVPDDENFAMTPLLAPLLDYEYTDAPGKHAKDLPEVKWKQPEVRKRLVEFHGVGELKNIALTQRHKRLLTDLAAWQAKLRTDTNFNRSMEGLSKPIILPGTTNTPAGASVGFDSNFAAKEILKVMSTYDPEMNELHAAAKRPYAQFPIHIEEGLACLLPHLQALRNFGRVAHLKAVALLAEERPDEALDEILLIIRFAESFRNEPVLISGLVDIAMKSLVSGVVWEGMIRKRWTAQHLATIEKRLRDVDFLESYGRAIRGERALGVASMFRFRDRFEVFSQQDHIGTFFRWAPSGVFYQNLVHMGRMYDEFVLHPVDFERKTIDFATANRSEAKMQEVLGTFHPYRICAALMFPAFNKVLQRYGEAQAEVDQLRLACAIEQFRAQKNKLPASLADLVPGQLPKLPHDPVNGENYIYRPSGGEYLIYSVGYDGADDGGLVVWKDKEPDQRARDQGDWVWNSSVAAPKATD